MSEIEILADSASARERGLFGNSAASTPKPVSGADLKRNWEEVCAVLSEAFSREPSVNGFEVGEITISLAVSAEGKFQLIAGASASASATVEIKFSRKTDGS